MGPERERLLDLDARRRIMEVVREHAGLHLRGLAATLGMPVSSLEYHLHQMVRHNLLTTREEGGYKAFYPASGLDRRDRDALYLIRQKVPRHICTELLLRPGSTPGQLREVVGLSAATLSFHLKKLRTGGLVREVPDGRTKRLFVQDGERVADLLVAYRSSFLDDVVDRFVATWQDL